MARNIKTGVLVTADASGAVKALNLTEEKLDQLNATTKKTGNQTRKLKKETGETSGQMVSLSQAAALAGTALAAMGINSLVDDFIEVNTETDKLRGSLVTVTGDATLAAQAFGAIEEFAKTTPFTLNQSVEAFIKMKNLGLQPTEEALTSFGNTAAAQGKQLSDFIEAVADASTNEFERLKEFGIKSQQQGDQVTFTFQGVETTIEKSSENIVQYLQNVGDVAFAGAMSEQMQRLPGLFANLEDAADNVFRTFGDAGATFIAQDILGSMIADTNDLAETTDEAFEFMVAAVGHFANALQGLEIITKSVVNFTRFMAIQELKAIDWLVEQAIELINLIPGVDIDYDGSTLNIFIESMQKDLDATAAEITALMETELASDNWDDYVRTVRNRVEDAKAETKSLNETLEDINNTMNMGEEGANRFATGLTLLEKKASDADKTMKGLGKSFERTFGDLLTGAIDSMDEFFDRLGGMAQRLASELALTGLKGLLSGGGGLAVAGASGAAAAGGTAGTAATAAGGTSLGNAAGFLGAGLFADGALTTGLYEQFGSLFGSESASAAHGVLADGGLTSTAPGTAGSLGSNIASFAGSALASLGAGMIGSQIGNIVGEALFGKQAESAIGAAAGGTIGALVGGPIGAGIGSLIGSFADVLFGGDGKKRVNLGVQAGGQIHSQVQRTEIGESGLALSSVTKRTGAAGVGAANDLLAAFVDIDERLVSIANAADVVIDLAGAVLSGKGTEAGIGPKPHNRSFFGSAEFNQLNQADLEASADEFVAAWLMEVNDQLPRRAALILDGVRGTADELVAAFEAALNIEELIDIDVVERTEDAMRALGTAQLDLMQRYQEATAELKVMAGELDSSAESIVDLSGALTNQKVIAATLAVAFHSLSDSVSASIALSIDAIAEQVLNDEELYTQRRAQIAELMGELGHAVSPEEIGSLVGQITQLSRSAFALVGEGERDVQAPEFIAFLQSVETIAEAQIAAGLALLAAEEGAASALLNESIDGLTEATAALAASTADFSGLDINAIINAAAGAGIDLSFLATVATTFNVAAGNINAAATTLATTTGPAVDITVNGAPVAPGVGPGIYGPGGQVSIDWLNLTGINF